MNVITFTEIKLSDARILFARYGFVKLQAIEAMLRCIGLTLEHGILFS